MNLAHFLLFKNFEVSSEYSTNKSCEFNAFFTFKTVQSTPSVKQIPTLPIEKLTHFWHSKNFSSEHSVDKTDLHVSLNAVPHRSKKSLSRDPSCSRSGPSLQHVPVGALVGPSVEQGRRIRTPGPPGAAVVVVKVTEPVPLLLGLGTGFVSCVPVQRVLAAALAAPDHTATALVHEVRARRSGVRQVVRAYPGRGRAHRGWWWWEETLQACL